MKITRTTRTIGVGDMLYQHQQYRRANEPKWIEHVIKGETKFSWLVEEGFAEQKVNKKTMLTKADYRGHHDRFFTRDQMIAQDFCDKHARDVGRAVQQCKNPDDLQAIARIIGMELKP